MTLEPLLPEPAPTSVAVFGGTGFAGRNIVHEAAGRGHEVRVYSRRVVMDGSRKDAVSFHQGSVFDIQALRNAAKWADAIIVAVPARDVGDGKLVDAVAALLEVGAANDTRIGFIGDAGILRVTEDGPLLMEAADFPAADLPESAAHQEVLDALRASDSEADWFYLSPAPNFGSAAPGIALGKYRTGGDVLLPTEGAGPLQISGADLALAVVDEIDDPQHHGERFSVAH